MKLEHDTIERTLAELGVECASPQEAALVSCSPIDGSPLGSVRACGAAEVDAMVETARRAFASWRLVPAPRRGELIRLYAETSGNPEIGFREELAGDDLNQRFSPLLDDGLKAAYQGVLDDGKRLGLVRGSIDVNAWLAPAFVQQALQDLKLQAQWRATDANGKALAQAAGKKGAA